MTPIQSKPPKAKTIWPYLSLAVALLATTPFSRALAEGDPQKIQLKTLTCPECTDLPKTIQTLEASLKSHTDGLEKNQTYLAALAPSDVSKAIKVKSNILIYLVRIETFKNNLQVVRSQKDSPPCKACGGSR